MKKSAFIICCLMMISRFCIGQDDLQWLIFENKGKDGLQTTLPTKNNYVNPIPPSNNFTLYNIKHPDITYYPFVKNDIFVIYEDGSHFNSRVKNPSTPNPGFFYPPNPADTTQRVHNLSGTYTGSPIKYLYLSNIYEDDDLPGLVQVFGNHHGLNPNPYVFSKTTSQPQILFSDHDVVRSKDITLIIDYQQLKSYAAGLNFTPPFYLTFDTIKEVGTKQPIINNHFFSFQPIFQIGTSGAYTTSYPIGSTRMITSPRKIELKQDINNFIYVNLRPATDLDSYYPGASGATRYNAIFSIVDKNGQFVTNLSEELRNSHDPNFIRIESICESTNREYYIYYHLQFENTSINPANDISVSFQLPPGYYPNCFDVLEWYLGGSSTSGTLTQNGMNVTFEFPDGISIRKCLSPVQSTNCIGYVKFRAKVNSGINVGNASTSLQMINPVVIFKGVQYSIDKFEDLTNSRTDCPDCPISYHRPVKAGNCEFPCR